MPNPTVLGMDEDDPKSGTLGSGLGWLRARFFLLAAGAAALGESIRA